MKKGGFYTGMCGHQLISHYMIIGRREEKAHRLHNKRKRMDSPFTTVLHKCQKQMICACNGTLECDCKCYKGADSLSSLPDEILVSILSLLKLKEAARTCILSRRWKNLWLYNTGTLNFDYSDKFDFYSHCFRISRRICENGRLRLVERQSLVAWVNHVLSVHRASTIDEFEVSCALYGRIKQNYFDEWVEFALQKNVKRLKLDFRGKIFSSVGNYSLMKPLLHKYNLESLTVLSLRKVEVTSEVVQYILFKCSLLEVLCVEGSSSLVELKIPASLSRLKCVEIKTTMEMKCFEIHAVNIQSFTYHGYGVPVTFEKAPHLVEASFGRSYAPFFVANIGQFSSCIRHLELLVLDFRCSTYLSSPQLSILENLRQLELLFCGIDVETIINTCASWLEICPVLRRFVLEACPTPSADHHKDGRIEGETKCLHGCLRVFEVLNASYHEEEAVVACFIVSNIPSLEQVIVHPFCSPIENLNAGFKERAIEFAKRLEKVMPPTAELIVST